ncbi:MAG: lectin like domain-containing protein [Nitrospirota bacterium]
MLGKSSKICGFIAASSFSLLTILSGAAQAGETTLQSAPLNPNFVKAITKMQAAKAAGTWKPNVAKGGHGLGRLPDRIDHSYLLTAAKKERAASIQRNGAAAATTTMPAIYDLRTLGKIGSVKNQGDCGSCWDFAAMASLESTLPKGTAFSENDVLDSDGFTLGPNDGGDDSMVIAYLTRWGGPKTETQYPYQYQWPEAPVADTSTANTSVHVQDVYMVAPDPYDIKHAIWTNKGALTLSFYYDDSLYYQNVPGFSNVPSAATIACFYNPYVSNDYFSLLPNGGGHEVAVIGWDDTYPASKFTPTGNTPPGDGAYLCRNEWGAYWGSKCGNGPQCTQGGYFYISYYDKSIINYGGPAYFYKPSPASAYTTVYQYDPLGQTRPWSYIDGSGKLLPDAWIANVFKADNAGSKIKAVGFYVNDATASYEIKIYDNVQTDGNGNITDPTNGTLVCDQLGGVQENGTASVPAGYHTIALKTPAKVTAGDNFSVVVHLKNDQGDGYPIAIEDQINNDSYGYSDRAYSTPG